MKKEIVAGLSILLPGILSCRPVIAIGWGEFLIITAVLVLLVGPPVYRFVRKMEYHRKQRDDNQ